MKLNARDAESFVRRPDAAVTAALIYGPDAGLVRERADALAAAVVADPSDPFMAADLTGDALPGDPARLADEIGASSLVGGRRLVRVRGAGDSICQACADVLPVPPAGNFLLLEAGDLPARSRLRKLFEAEATAAAVPCYLDDSTTLSDVIETELSAFGLTVAPDAHAFLLQRLGGDRAMTRGELRKLALYKGSGQVELDDVVACVDHGGALSMEQLAVAVADGDTGEVELIVPRLVGEGMNPVGILRGATRHFQRLHLAAGRVAAGVTPRQAIDGLRPPVFYKLKPAFDRQLRTWTVGRLASALDRLSDAELQCKRTGMPDTTVCHRTLLALAASARAP